VKKGQLSVEWKVVAESNPDTDLGDDSKDGDTGLGLKNLSYIKRLIIVCFLLICFSLSLSKNGRRRLKS
jgi:hypothetical protein